MTDEPADPGADQMRAHVRKAFSDAELDLEAMVPRGGRTTDYIDLRDTDSERMVYVFAHGDWHLGELRAYRKRGDAWEGNVVWSEGIGSSYVDWVPQQRIRPASD